MTVPPPPSPQPLAGDCDWLKQQKRLVFAETNCFSRPNNEMKLEQKNYSLEAVLFQLCLVVRTPLGGV